MTTCPTPFSCAFGALLLAMLAGCGGVKVGGRTLVEPIAPAVAVERPRLATLERDASGAVGVDPPAAQTRTSPGPVVLAARASTGCFVAGGRPFDRTPPSTAPVDPWRAVDGDHPRVLPHETTPYVEEGDTACDAAHDHCLRDCSWLVSHELPPYRTQPVASEQDATAAGFEGGGYAAEDPFQAFRSVPVTRRNLDVGMLVLVADDAPRPGVVWKLGVATEIDWDAGTLRLDIEQHHDPYPLAWARVAVLRYQPGGRVEVVNGLTREQVEVRADELVPMR